MTTAPVGGPCGPPTDAVAKLLGGLGRVFRLGGSLLGAEALLEPGHAAACVEDLLLAGVEGVTLRADLGVDHAVLRGAAGCERRAAGAGGLGLDVFGMDLATHGELLGSRSPGRSGSDAAAVNRNQMWVQCARGGTTALTLGLSHIFPPAGRQQGLEGSDCGREVGHRAPWLGT